MFSWESMHYAARLGGEGYGTAYEYMAKARFFMRALSELSCDGLEGLLILGLPQKYGLSLDFLFWAEYLRVSKVLVFDTRDDKLDLFLKGRQWLIERGILKDLPVAVLRDWESLSDLDLSSSVIVSCESFQSWEEEKRSFAGKLYDSARCGFCFVPNDYNDAHRKITHLPTIEGNNLKRYFSNLVREAYLDCPPVPSGLKLPAPQGDVRSFLRFGGRDRLIYLTLAFCLFLDEMVCSRCGFYRTFAHLYGVVVEGNC